MKPPESALLQTAVAQSPVGESQCCFVPRLQCWKQVVDKDARVAFQQLHEVERICPVCWSPVRSIHDDDGAVLLCWDWHPVL